MGRIDHRLAWLLWTALPAAAQAQTVSPFAIRVTDEDTGRGVPLVELKTTGDVSWWTDSAGIVAFQEPGLMDQEVYFHLNSPGYDYPRDFFKNRGVKLKVTSGGRAEVKLKRTQIAERLYRVTGQGIYRDSVLVGEKPPTRNPTLNGQVVGQDTVIVAPYRGKLFWFWGDTERASYPLGNFGASGATSELPGNGGLDPGAGVDLTYFVGEDGFSKPMCPNSEFGEGLKWIEGVVTLREGDREILLARLAAGTGLEKTREWHLAKFNDDKAIFESLVRWDVHDGHDSSHPFRALVNGQEYLYLFPDFRVKAELAAMRDLGRYEAFTCVAGDGTFWGAETAIDRDEAGRPRYAWKAGAERLRTRELIKLGKLKPAESWLFAHDVDTGKPVDLSRGSVCWNDYRQRWIMIGSGAPGEIWLSEADTPTGPWLYAKRVAEHGRYNFYNPTQHPYFDQDNGRVIHFEGTYTATFSGAPAQTPRYDYNQIMYRLSLDDPRLTLPAPVYRVEIDGASRFLMCEGVEAANAWDRVREIAFLAIHPQRRSEGLMPLWPSDTTTYQTSAPTPNAKPLFLALPPDAPATPITELRRGPGGQALCRVWKNPSLALAMDPSAKPKP